MDKNYTTVKEVILHNNCPECYSKGSLLLIFKQKIKETQFYKSITSEISHEIQCKTCLNPIYPVQWTDDIERMVEYQQKAFTPMVTSTYIKKTSWIIIASIFIIGFGIGLAIALI
jgi:hypothetical protein